MQERNVRGEQFARLHERDTFRVSPEDPDPTGWTVVDRSGERVGRVDELIVDTSAMKVRYLEIELDDARSAADHVLVGIDEIDLLDDQHKAVLRALVRTDIRQRMGEGLRQQSGRGTADIAHDRGRMAEDTARLTRSEEELRIGKREVQSGEVVVGKHVETERVSTPVERNVEHVRVERRPATGQAAGSASIEDREIRVPIMEEETVVEKRPVVKEEVVITKETETARDNVEADLRKERLDVKGEGEVTEETRDEIRDRSPDKGGRRG